MIMRANTCSGWRMSSLVPDPRVSVGPSGCGSNGVARVLPAAALRHHRGLGGQAKVYAPVSAYLHKRSRWMRFQSYRRQPWPIGNETTEVACKIVFAQRLKRSGMSWTISGGQGILELCVIW